MTVVATLVDAPCWARPVGAREPTLASGEGVGQFKIHVDLAHEGAPLLEGHFRRRDVPVQAARGRDRYPAAALHVPRERTGNDDGSGIDAALDLGPFAEIERATHDDVSLDRGLDAKIPLTAYTSPYTQAFSQDRRFRHRLNRRSCERLAQRLRARENELGAEHGGATLAQGRSTSNAVLGWYLRIMRRRQLIAATGATVAGSLLARSGLTETSKHWSLEEIVVEGERDIGQRFTLLTPKHTTKKTPLVMLLHGLGETHDQHVGANAWVDRYGLGSAYDRLCEPPVKRASKYPYWTDELLAKVNRQLSSKAFRGLTIVCPFTPNVYKARRGRKAALDLYADWLVDVVLPRARKEANVYADADHTYLDGCSLGGYVGAEVFLRKARHFGAWGTLQGALGAHRVAGYAERIAALQKKHGTRPIHVETSTGDAFRDVNERFHQLLKKRGVDHDFVMPPGPHNQPFLRDSGTLIKLLWLDRLPR